jgi:hypothetical protein
MIVMRMSMGIVLAIVVTMPATAEPPAEPQFVGTGVEIVGQPSLSPKIRDEDGKEWFIQSYVVRVDTGKAVTAILFGPQVPYQHLIIRGPDRFIAASDSSMLPAPCRVASGRAAVAGFYICEVRTVGYLGGDTYTLKVESEDTEVLFFTAGHFNFGDQTLQTGGYVDVYRVEVREGDRLLFSMMSGAVNPYLVITMPASNVSAENDDKDATSRNSEIEWEAPASGTVVIHATTAPLPGRRSQQGGYVLSVERTPAPTL